MNPIDALVRRLRSIGTLTESDEAGLRTLPLRLVDLQKGEPIVQDGTLAQHCCLVVEGYAHRTKTLANGNRQIFSLHMAGDIPDLHSLHLRRMDHELAALSRCRVAYIPHGALKELLSGSPALTGLMWRDTLIDAAAFRAWMLMLGQAEAPARMAHLFCELFVRARMAHLTEGSRFDMPLTQIDLADVLGISLVHANRTLQDLRARGLIGFDQQSASILRWEELKALGQFDVSYLHYLDDDADHAIMSDK
jgi:CRP-like cAMP-binding protein